MGSAHQRKGTLVERRCGANNARRVTAALTAILFAWGAVPAWEGGPVALIGNSNTESGTIVLALLDSMQAGLGDHGSGYYAATPTFGSRPPGMNVEDDGDWLWRDMVYGSGIRRPEPYLSPSGHWITSRTSGVVAQVTFNGSGIDIYYCTSSRSGSFQVKVDGAVKTTVSTQGARAVKRYAVTGLADTEHTMEVVAQADSVRILGFDIRRGSVARGRRAVVHNLGNAAAAAKDFTVIDGDVFATALQDLVPAVVVILLGTNDHNNDEVPADEFKNHLVTLINRVKNAVPDAKVLLVSTMETDTPEAQTLLPRYLETSYPEAAEQTGVVYWDMSAWLGTYDSTLMHDALHLNTEGGAVVAAELWHRIQLLFGNSTVRPRMAHPDNHYRSRTHVRLGVRLDRGMPGRKMDLRGRRRGPIPAAGAVLTGSSKERER